MAYEELQSREYKVMLEATLFGPPGELAGRAAEFWSAVRKQPVGSDKGQKLADELDLSNSSDWTDETPGGRPVEFIDTVDGQLYSRDYVLRRRGTGSDTRVTMKKRSPDRVIASHNHISWRRADKNRPNKGDRVKTKFEEDIKVTDDGRLRSLFSHSVDVEGRGLDGLDITSVGDADELFPGFKEGVGLSKKTELGRILNPISEHVLEFDGQLRFLGGKDTRPAAALVAWYADGSVVPCVVEFSFKHKGIEADFDSDVAARCAVMMKTLARMDPWRPQTKITKTRWVYREAGIPKP